MKPSKNAICHVTLLDGTEYQFDVEKNAVGKIVLDRVADYLELLEKGKELGWRLVLVAVCICWNWVVPCLLL